MIYKQRRYLAATGVFSAETDHHHSTAGGVSTDDTPRPKGKKMNSKKRGCVSHTVIPVTRKEDITSMLMQSITSELVQSPQQATHSIPPTDAGLMQHITGARYLSRHLWGQTLNRHHHHHHHNLFPYPSDPRCNKVPPDF